MAEVQEGLVEAERQHTEDCQHKSGWKIGICASRECNHLRQNAEQAIWDSWHQHQAMVHKDVDPPNLMWGSPSANPLQDVKEAASKLYHHQG